MFENVKRRIDLASSLSPPFFVSLPLLLPANASRRSDLQSALWRHAVITPWSRVSTRLHGCQSKDGQGFEKQDCTKLPFIVHHTTSNQDIYVHTYSRIFSVKFLFRHFPPFLRWSDTPHPSLDTICILTHLISIFLFIFFGIFPLLFPPIPLPLFPYSCLLYFSTALWQTWMRRTDFSTLIPVPVRSLFSLSVPLINILSPPLFIGHSLLCSESSFCTLHSCEPTLMGWVARIPHEPTLVPCLIFCSLSWQSIMGWYLLFCFVLFLFLCTDA
jgi:hypothetical protein